MRLLILLALIGAGVAMPMTSYTSRSGYDERALRERARCRDNNGNYYNVGMNFRRVGDNWICNCTYEFMRTRLQCRSPFYSRSSLFGGGSYFEPGYIERSRSIAADHCVYEGQVHNLNTKWKMNVNGVMMDCTCDGNAYMRCHMASSSSSRTISRLPVDNTDFKCQTALYRNGEEFVSRQPGGFYSICSCSASLAATCRVLTVSGLECQFPFEDSGRFYSTCTSRRDPSQPPSCVTSAFGVQPKTMSNCITKLQDFRRYYRYVFTIGGNANGARCHFPFTYRNVQYNQCTTVGRSQAWCATTSNYARDRRFGYCQATSQTTASSREIYNRVGEPVTIECRYERINGRSPPIITWYKIGDDGRRRRLYTYDTATGRGNEATTAGSYSGRLRMPNGRQLIIDDMRVGDAGTFECDVRYQGVQEINRRTDVAVLGQNSPKNLRYIYTPRINRLQIMWDNPDIEYDSLKLEYQEENSRRISQVLLPRDRSSYVTGQLRPGATYEIRIYTVIGGQDSSPVRMRLPIPAIQRRSNVARPVGGIGESTPSEAQPLAQPRVTGNNIFLTWYSSPVPDTVITEWLVVYEDLATGDLKNVTLSSSTDSVTLTNLKSGQRYRITLYALVDENQIEVATTDVTTEHIPDELPSQPLVQESTPSTVTITWDAPRSGQATTYNIAYRPANNPRAPWRTYSIPASRSPSTTLRNLQPATQYEIQITPISDQRRGTFVPISASTAGVTHNNGPVGQPKNLRIADITRSSFLVTWEQPDDGNDVRRYRVVFHPADDDRNPIERTTSRTSYRAYGLLGGLAYTVRVFSIVDDAESAPAVTTATTVDEVCLVGNRWRGADEKFYKRNPSGYMQNCTCSRTTSGGRWQCDPILCEGNNGNSYQVDETWSQVHASGDYIEACTCTLRGKFCKYKEAIIQPQQPTVRQPLGGRLVLECPHETEGRERPIVRWYKLTSSGRVPLYTYYGTARLGRASVEAGHLNGRMSMPDEVRFVINPVQAADEGVYECIVQYPSSVTHTTHQTRIDVVSQDGAPDRDVPAYDSSILVLPAEPVTNEITDDAISITWEAPSGDVTGYVVEYQDTDDESSPIRRTQVTDTSFVLRGLNPSTTYRVTVIPITDDVRGEPSSFLVRTNDTPEPIVQPAATTRAPIAPQPPTDLRFENIGRTSITSRWRIPAYPLTPVDSYRVEYKPQGAREDQTVTRNVVTRSYQASNLKPGTAYLFRVYSVINGVESQPVSSVVSTSPIGRLFVRASNRRRSDRLGSDANLGCSWDSATPGEPTVAWYKRDRDGSRIKLASFDTSADVGSQFTEAETVGDYTGRLEIVDQSSLTIRNLRSSDHGYYVCEVTYPTGGGSDRTQINIVGVPNPVEITSPEVGKEESEYTLSWTIEPAPSPDSFLLNIRRRGSRKRYIVFSPPGGARSFLFRNLRPGGTYEGNMVAKNRYGASPTTEFSFTTASSGVPNRPARLHLSSRDPTSMTVHIDGPSNDVTFYRIRYVPEVDIDGVTEEVVEGNSEMFLNDLLPNTAYVLRVTAINNNGESSPLTHTITTPPELPETPVSVRVDRLIPRGVTLTILGPNDNADYYEVSYQPTIGSKPKRTQRTSKNMPTVSLVLEPGTQYRIGVVAGNEFGKSPRLESTITTPQERAPPARPQSFTSIRPGSTSASLTWNGPTDDVQYYVVEYRANGDREPVIQNTPGIQKSVVISGLLPETQYSVSVKAVGEGGHSPKLVDYFRTEPAAPQPNDFTITGAFPDEVTFNVEGINAPTDYFIVQYYPVGNEDEQVEFRVTDQEITLTNLEPGTRYRVTVIAVRGSDRSVPLVKEVVTSGQRIAVVPEAPSNVRRLDKGADFVSFMVEGVAPLTDEDDYLLVTYRPTSREGPTEEIRVNNPRNELTISNLQPVTRYRLQIQTVKGGLKSENYTTYFITDRVQEQLAPTNLQTSSVSSDEISLIWDAPEDLDLVVRYVVEYREDSRQDLPYTRLYIPKTGTSATLSGLNPNTDYDVRVNTIGRSDDILDGVSTTMRTLRRPVESVTPTTQPRVIEAPRGVVVSRRLSDQAELRWNPAPNPNEIDGYLVQFEPTFDRQGNPQTLNIPSRNTSATLTSLTPGTEYQVRIYTVVGSRESEPASATFITELDSPSNLKATPQTDRIVVTWDNPVGPSLGSRFAYRRGEGRWRERFLSRDVTRYAIPLRRGETDAIEIAVTAVGGTIQSEPATLLVYPRQQAPPEADFPITGTYVDEVSDRRASVVFQNTRNYAPDGWTLTLLDDEEIIGSPVRISEDTPSHPLQGLKAGHIYTISVQDTDGNEISRNDFMTKVAKPRNVSTIEVSHDDAVLSWESPDDKITGYVVRYKPIGERDWLEKPVDASDNPTATLNNLHPDTVYQVVITSLYRDTVVERNETGIPAFTRFVTSPRPEPTPPPIPSPVSNIRFIDITEESARAMWEPSPDHDDVVYRVVLRQADDNSLVVTRDWSSSFASFTGLRPDTEYVLYVTAVRGTTRSEATSKRFSTILRQPLRVEINNVDDSSFNVTWRPAVPEDPNLTSYLVRVSPTDSNETPIIERVSSDTTGRSFRNLHPGTTYDISVTPVVPDGESNPVFTRITTDLPSPENVVAREVTHSSLRVTWNQPNDEITDYYVEYRPSTTTDSNREYVRDATDILLTYLTPDTPYVISVYSTYNRRRSLPSVVNAITPPETIVRPPENAEILDSRSPSVGPSSISVRWTPTTAINTYRVVVIPEGEIQPVFDETFTYINETTIEGLSPSTSYLVEVYSVYNSDEQSSPIRLTQTTKPRQPSTVSVQDVDDTSILFTWPDQTIDGTDVTGYVFKYRPVGGDVVERIVGEPSISLSDLPPLTRIEDISVETIVGSTRSAPYRYPTTVRTGPRPAPYRINILPEPEAGPDSYIITWTPVPDYQGPYEITYHPSDESQSRRIVTRPGDTSERLPRLLPGVKYVVSVNPSDSPVPDSTTSKDIITDVPAPISVSINSITDDSAVVDFVARDYDTVTMYEVRYFPVGSPTDVERRRVRPDGDKRMVLEDLQPNTEYGVQVLTYAGHGTSRPTAATFATLPTTTSTTSTTTTTTTMTTTTTTTSQAMPANSPTEGSPAPLDSTRVDNGVYKVRWQAFPNPVRHYKVVYVKESGGPSQKVVVPSFVGEFDLTTLLSDETYRVTVVAVLPTNEEVNVGSIEIETEGEGTGERSATVEWDQPVSGYSGFRITANPQNNPAATPMVWDVGPDENSARLTGLLPGTRYRVLVEGLSDGEYIFIMETVINTAVDSPTNLRATKVVRDAIYIEWDKPAAPINRYSVTYQLNGRGTEVTYMPAPRPTAEKMTLRNLTPGQRYVIRLYASSPAGDSPPAQLWTETVVPPPTRLQIRQVTPNLIGIKWEKPTSAITHYTLRLLGPDRSVLINNQRIEPDETSHTIRNLQPGTRYHIYLTAWVRDIPSNSAYRSTQTPRQISDISSNRGKLTNDGYLVSWRGRSRAVEGWLIVTESEDGQDRSETRVDRFTKRYQLDNLREGVAYTVKIYPYSGNIYGEPSLITIPASQTRTITTSTVWSVQAPQLDSNSVTLMWNSPWLNSPIEDYELMYKRAEEPDSAYRLAPVQPTSSDHSVTINHLESGQAYLIRLTAYRNLGRGDERQTLQLIANVTTPLPAPTSLHMQTQTNGDVVFQWQPSPVEISYYVLQYRVDSGATENEYRTLRVGGNVSSYTLTTLEPGQRYEIRLYAVRGGAKSNTLVLRLDIPAAPAEECVDPQTRQVYQVGQHWILETRGFRMNCSCNGPQSYDCNAGNWCQVDGRAYNPGDTWRLNQPNNKKEVCICADGGKYNCYPRNCYDNGSWHDAGSRWPSGRPNMGDCICACTSEVTAPCETRCGSAIFNT